MTTGFTIQDPIYGIKERYKLILAFVLTEADKGIKEIA